MLVNKLAWDFFVLPYAVNFTSRFLSKKYGLFHICFDKSFIPLPIYLGCKKTEGSLCIMSSI